MTLANSQCRSESRRFFNSVSYNFRKGVKKKKWKREICIENISLINRRRNVTCCLVGLSFSLPLCKINSYSPLGLSLNKFSRRLVFQKDKNLKKERRKKEKIRLEISSFVQDKRGKLNRNCCRQDLCVCVCFSSSRVWCLFDTRLFFIFNFFFFHFFPCKDS